MVIIIPVVVAVVLQERERQERAEAFFFAALGALRAGAFAFFLALVFLAMKFQT